ncbi:retrovirus-related pol polyprotein from transposon TNT 1-94 [Tanacetum coccineum]
MANLSEDIQCAGSDTRPPLLDWNDFASWQQRNEGALNLGPERARVYSDLSSEDKERHWDNVKMLLEGSELTKEDRESQLYGDFEHFCQNKRETIHDYYVRFTKLINDMRNIKITMPRMQLNSKFVYNMLPEWGRFITTVKLNRGLKDSNYDQLYAYLKQHEAHANENNMMNQATVQDGRVVVQNVQGRQNRGQARQIKCYNCNGIGHIARNCTQPKRPQNSEYFKDKMLLMQAQENGVALDEEQLLFIAGGQDNTVDEDVDEQPIQDLALNVDNVFQADDYDAFNSDVDEAPAVQTMFMVAHCIDYTMTLWDVFVKHHYVKDNVESVVQSNVSSVPNDAYMMIINEVHEQTV